MSLTVADITTIENFTAREDERFRRIVNTLFSSTFIAPYIIKEEKRIPNQDYNFLTKHGELISDYLELSGWELNKSEHHDYFYVSNEIEVNRMKLNKEATGIILALRLIYDENSETAGLNQDVEIKVRDLLDKAVTDYPFLSTRGTPNMKDVARYLRLMEDHLIVQRISGRFNEVDCRFLILPTILTVVSAEKIRTLVTQLKADDGDSAAAASNDNDGSPTTDGIEEGGDQKNADIEIAAANDSDEEGNTDEEA